MRCALRDDNSPGDAADDDDDNDTRSKCVDRLLEKLTGPQLFEKFAIFQGTRKFITAFTRAPPPVPILSHINPVNAPSLIQLPEDSSSSGSSCSQYQVSRSFSIVHVVPQVQSRPEPNKTSFFTEKNC